MYYVRPTAHDTVVVGVKLASRLIIISITLGLPSGLQGQDKRVELCPWQEFRYRYRLQIAIKRFYGLLMSQNFTGYDSDSQC